jgi:multidrug efflux pump subunit AcrA (membrane-fusion protein)
MIETQLLAELADLEGAALREQDARYVRLVIDVSTHRMTDPETIHAALKALDRTPAQLQTDLERYRQVRGDFDIFARLGACETQLVADDQRARDAEQVLLSSQVALIAAERLVVANEIALREATRVANVARSLLIDCRAAGERLVRDPSRLRFLPASFRERMTKVYELRDHRMRTEASYQDLRERAGALRKQSMDCERRIAHLGERDYFACSPALDMADIGYRQRTDRQEIANLRTAIDANTSQILSYETQASDAKMQLDTLTVDLEHARAELAGALSG